MRPAVLMIMVDALRHDYVTEQDAPFLHALAQAGRCGSLAPSFGFEPDAAYFAGLTPEQADGGAQFWKHDGDRLFRAVGLFALLDRVPVPAWRRLLRKGVRAVAQAFAADPLPRRMAAPAFIPYDQLARFSLSLKVMADDPRAFAGRSVFDHARSAGASVYFHGFPQYAVKTGVVRDRLLAEADGRHDLYFLFMGDLDGVGHHHGPDSTQRRATLRQVDAAIERMVTHLRARHSGVDALVFGDHGMAEVRGEVDLRPAIERAGLDVRRDSWFLDSTMARFWVADPARRARLREVLAEQRGGRLLDDADRARYAIRWPHRRFGDEIFAVDDHLVVHPCFYAGDAAPRGMHGYLPGCRDNESAFVLAGPRVPRLPPVHSTDMRRVHATVMGLLGKPQAAAPGITSLAVA